VTEQKMRDACTLYEPNTVVLGLIENQ